MSAEINTSPTLMDQNFRAPTSEGPFVAPELAEPLVVATPEATPAEARQILINEVLSPYHIHYANGIEGTDRPYPNDLANNGES